MLSYTAEQLTKLEGGIDSILLRDDKAYEHLSIFY